MPSPCGITGSYFTGQVISVSGTWMQTVSQAYLILFPLHGTGLDVAIATSLQFLPMLLLGPFGGLIADRLDKRKVLYVTQGTAGILALDAGPAGGDAFGDPVADLRRWRRDSGS